MSRAILILSLLVFCTSVANAQSLRFATDPKAPVDVKAGVIDWRGETRIADFSDGAEFVQGPLAMTAQTMRLTVLPNGAAGTLTARGQVEVVSSDAQGGVMRRAFAEQAVYQPAAETLILSGNVEVRETAKRQSVLTGAVLEIDVRSGRGQLTGGGDKPRARIELR